MERYIGLIMKWEFLKRNDEYRRDCAIFFDEAKERNISPDALIESDHYEVIFKKYDVVYPMDPNREIDEPLGKGKGIPTRKLMTAYKCFFPVPVYCLTQDCTRRTDAFGDVEIKNWPIEVFKEMIAIQLLIDLRSPVEDILKSTKKIVLKWQKRRTKVLGKETRVRVKEYKRYLAVYDLVKQGCSWEKLAKKFYIGDVERQDLNYAKRKVKRDYERCVKLINGGYRQIR